MAKESDRIEFYFANSSNHETSVITNPNNHLPKASEMDIKGSGLAIAFIIGVILLIRARIKRC